MTQPVGEAGMGVGRERTETERLRYPAGRQIRIGWLAHELVLKRVNSLGGGWVAVHVAIDVGPEFLAQPGCEALDGEQGRGGVFDRGPFR